MQMYIVHSVKENIYCDEINDSKLIKQMLS